MSQIKGKNTKPEMLVRKFLFANGYRYRLHVKNIPGKPDIVLTKHKIIVDIRGCFWHKHADCRYGDLTKTPSTEITTRRDSAVVRDAQNIQVWEKLGWSVIVIWSECELEPRKVKSEKREATLSKLLRILNNGNTNN